MSDETEASTDAETTPIINPTWDHVIHYVYFEFQKPQALCLAQDAYMFTAKLEYVTCQQCIGMYVEERTGGVTNANH
jgi:hypothetical protein